MKILTLGGGLKKKIDFLAKNRYLLPLRVKGFLRVKSLRLKGFRLKGLRVKG